VTLSASSLLQQASHAAATVRGKASASVTLSNNLSYTFDPSKPLGKGNQGAVFAASSTQDGSLIALKLAEKKSVRIYSKTRLHLQTFRYNHVHKRISKPQPFTFPVKFTNILSHLRTHQLSSTSADSTTVFTEVTFQINSDRAVMIESTSTSK